MFCFLKHCVCFILVLAKFCSFIALRIAVHVPSTAASRFVKLQDNVKLGSVDYLAVATSRLGCANLCAAMIGCDVIGYKKLNGKCQLGLIEQHSPDLHVTTTVGGGWAVYYITADDCYAGACQNGGDCFDDIGQYKCVCVLGYDGNNCETDIDECATNPCQNDATCVDGIGQYSCVCVLGYDGNNCETDIGECATNPCQNSAGCVNGIGYYTCNCVSPWSGTNCDVSPCGNGWTYGEADNHCYRISGFTATWAYARDTCTAFDSTSHLIDLNNANEQVFLVQLYAARWSATTFQIWTGGTDAGPDNSSEGWYYWTDFTGFDDTIDIWGGSYWQPGQPGNNAFLDCLVVNSNGKFAEADCYDYRYFVCERDIPR